MLKIHEVIMFNVIFGLDCCVVMNFGENWAIIMKVVISWIGVDDWIGEIVVMLKWIWLDVVVVNLFGCGIKLVKMGFYE